MKKYAGYVFVILIFFASVVRLITAQLYASGYMDDMNIWLPYFNLGGYVISIVGLCVATKGDGSFLSHFYHNRGERWAFSRFREP